MDGSQIANIVTALGTCGLVVVTLWLVKGQLSTATEQLKIRMYLELRREFDGDRLYTARKVFAGQLLDLQPHDEMNLDVLSFFEDMGMLFRRNYLDQEMVWETFGHFAKMWWSASVVSQKFVA
jgi:hypothetical protein